MRLIQVANVTLSVTGPKFVLCGETITQLFIQSKKPAIAVTAANNFRKPARHFSCAECITQDVQAFDKP